MGSEADGNQRQPRFLSLAFALLGIGVLCPWNAFINARAYFESRLCHPSSAIGNNIEVWFSLLYNIASVLSLVVLLVLQYYGNQRRQGDVRSVFHSGTTLVHPLSPSLRSLNRSIRQPTNNSSSMVLVPLWLYFAVFALTTLLVYVPEAPPVVMSYVTLIGLFLCGVCTSVASAGIIGTAGLFDADVGVGPYFQGQALGGLFVANMNAATTFFNDPSLYNENICERFATAKEPNLSDGLRVCVPYEQISYSTGAYFGLNCLILLGCIVGYLYVEREKNRLKIVRYAPLSEIKSQRMNRMDSTVSTFSTETESAGEDSYQGMAQNKHTATQHAPIDQHDVVIYVTRTVRLPALALFLTYLVTLSLFPVITSDLTSVMECQSQARVRNDMFVPLTFLIFNLGDLLGRFVVADDGIEKHRLELPRKLVHASLARFAFVPLFFLCYSRKSLYPEMAVHSDIFSWCVQLAMAVTNGILTTFSFSAVAVLLPADENMQQIASSILNLSLCLGLVAGGLVASPILWLYTGSW